MQIYAFIWIGLTGDQGFLPVLILAYVLAHLSQMLKVELFWSNFVRYLSLLFKMSLLL